MTKKSGLGRGFGSLLPENFDNSILLEKKERIQKIKIDQIMPDKNQPRKHFDITALDELAKSIKNHGILQPLVVRPHEDKYIIIAGERRFRAASLAGLESVPVLVRSSEELERLEIGLVENVQRVDLSPLEQAVSIAKLNQQFNLSIDEISKRLGKAKTTVINIVRLLKLPDEAKQALLENKISEGHARSILALSADRVRQKNLLNSIVEKGWSVRAAEKYVTQHKKAKGSLNTKDGLKQNKPTDQIKAVSKKLNAKITIQPKAKGGEVKIAFKDDADLQRILNLLS